MMVSPMDADALVREYANLNSRVDATLALHHPEAICLIHHITISPSHTCAEPLLYRCATCARTSPQPCRTWRTLTAKDKP